MTLLDAALDYATHGCSVVPVRPDGSKAVAVPWKPYQTTPPHADQLRTWFTPNGTGQAYDGLGIITGTVSGNLELLELEGRAVDEGLLAQLPALLADHGYGDLWARICGGFLERSPSGGMHWLYRVDGQVAGNTKLARRPSTTSELEQDPKDKIKVLVETRGEGGFVVVAPSAGRTHSTGLAWTMLAGGPDTIPTITVDERDALHAIANMLDQMPAIDAPAPRASSGSTSTPGDGRRPGDDYNERANWHDILEPAGWTPSKRFGPRCIGWTRPGKEAHSGISATTGRNDGDNLYVFSSSTEFEPETPYSKFGAYALLEHGGDYAAAASKLRTAGYGDPMPQPVLELVPGPADPPRPETVTTSLETGSRPPESGTAAAATQGATVTQLQPRPNTMLRSEDGHAHQLINAYGDLIRYCPERGRWLVWNGSRWAWQPPGGGHVREYAKKVARDLPGSDNAEITHKRRCLSSAGISGCLKQAETDHRVTVAISELDADPWTLNTPAGVVDLRTGHIHPPDPTSLCTKTTRVAPVLEQPDPAWAAFLADTFGDDHETRDYVQRLVGLTLIGQVREQLLAFLHGIGANGKSTLAETLMHALGVGETGYAIAAPAEMLMIRKHSEHPAELAQLAGARLVVCSELDEGQRFAEAKIKQLTGRDSINARFLYGQPFTFTPSHTIWLLGNHRPQARTGGMAFWRRVKTIEFGNVVPPERRDPALGDKLAAAAGTVLAWAIAGALDYLTGGIREPASVSEATAAYAADQDTIGRFVTDVCHRADSDIVRIPVSELRAAYETWCREVGEEPATAKRLTQELQDRFAVGDGKSNGRRFYTRITILEEPEPDSDPTLDLGTDAAPQSDPPASLPGLA